MFNKKILFVIFVILSIFVLSTIWYLASSLFLDKSVDEEFPVNLVDGNNETNKILFQGEFIDADSFHKVSGKAIVIQEEDEKYLRFENFQSTNGPDLKVYLSEDLSASSYISLGELKGNIGNQNYELDEVDLEKYNYVLIWCEQFSVLFGSADLN